MSVFVIAEMGSTHGGRLQTSLDLVDAAKAADADAFKGQFWSDSAKLAAHYNAPEKAEFYEGLRMPADWIPSLQERCRSHGLQFSCSLDLLEDVEAYGPFFDFCKIASFNAGDRKFIAAHLPLGKPIYISTGMMDGGQVADLRDWLFKLKGKHGARFCLLHCVSGYPVPSGEAGLGLLTGDTFNGYSDHTRSFLAGAVAVAAGAKVIEVHFGPEDLPADHPDAAVSFTPPGLAAYIHNVRQAEALLGDGDKRIMPCEEPWRRYRVKA